MSSIPDGTYVQRDGKTSAGSYFKKSQTGTIPRTVSVVGAKNTFQLSQSRATLGLSGDGDMGTATGRKIISRDEF